MLSSLNSATPVHWPTEMNSLDFSEYHLRAIAKYESIKDQCGFGIVPISLHKSSREVCFWGRIADPNNLTPTENRFSYPPGQYCTGYRRANIPCPRSAAAIRPSGRVALRHFALGAYANRSSLQRQSPGTATLIRRDKMGR